MIAMTVFAKAITAQRQSHISHIDGSQVLVTQVVIVTEDGQSLQIFVHAPADAVEPLTVELLPDRPHVVRASPPAAEGGALMTPVREASATPASRSRIERISDEERATFYPVKRWAVHFPAGKTDAHGARVAFYATKKEALSSARHPYEGRA